IPAERPVAPTMNADPTPMNAICEMISSGRKGGRKAHATASTAKRIIRPKSSNAACTLRIGASLSHGAAGAPIFAASRARGAESPRAVGTLPLYCAVHDQGRRRGGRVLHEVRAHARPHGPRGGLEQAGQGRVHLMIRRPP